MTSTPDPTIWPRRSVLGAGLALLIGTGCSREEGDDPAQAGITVLATPGGGIVPAALFDGDGVLHVAGVQGDDVVLQRSRDLGRTFDGPERVNDRAGFAAGGLFRGPEMAFDGDGNLHLVWYSQAWKFSKDKTEQGVMYTRRLRGGPFEPSRNLAREPSDGISVAASGRAVQVAWHNGEQLRLRHSADAGAAFAAPAAAEALPCECCDTVLAMLPDGRTLILYRDRTENRRDMFATLARPDAPIAKGVRLDDRSWVIDACPLSGSALVTARDGAWAAWEREGRIQRARLSWDPLQHAKVEDLGPGKLPVMASGSGGVLLAWNHAGLLHWQRFDANSGMTQAQGSLARKSPNRAAIVTAPQGGFLLLV